MVNHKFLMYIFGSFAAISYTRIILATIKNSSWYFQITKPGKQGTKGQKQILQENTDTLNFYRYMILGAAGIYFTIGMVFFVEFPTLDLVM